MWLAYISEQSVYCMIGKHQLSNLRAAIGGKWLASFKIFLFFAPIWLLISLLITPQINFRSFSFTTIANISGKLLYPNSEITLVAEEFYQNKMIFE